MTFSHHPLVYLTLGFVVWMAGVIRFFPEGM